MTAIEVLSPPLREADLTERVYAGHLLIFKLEEAAAMPVVIEPGDVLCFSGAHLHASVPNRTDAPRWSVELRTVCLADLGTGRGAPDVDGPPGPGRLSWFCRIADGGQLDGGTPRAKAS